MSRLADLHRHLDGSLRLATLHSLAAEVDLEVTEAICFEPGMGLDGALARFAITLSVLQAPDAVRQVAAQMCEDAIAEGLAGLEIRFAPQLHHGASVAEIVDAAIDGVESVAGLEHVGLILCALYGEDPAVAEDLVAIGAGRRRVVGLDIAGGPAPEHTWSMASYASAFAAAAEAGLGRTVHAGEGRPAAEIRAAIEVLGAQRIGHGTSLLDDPSVRDLVLERGVVIEACPTSNVHTGVLAAVTDHPIAAWLEAGVLACVCADNTLFSRTDAVSELDRLRGIEGIDDPAVRRLADNSWAGRFAIRE